MSNYQRITRSDHVASLALPPGRLEVVLGSLYRTDVLLRLGICVVAIICMWLISFGWAPPFAYRLGRVPARDICASSAFRVPDPDSTEKARKEQRREIRVTYVNDDRLLDEMRSELEHRVSLVLDAESLEGLKPEVWREFLPQGNDETTASGSSSVQSTVAFTGLRAALDGDAARTAFPQALDRAFRPFHETGLLENLEHGAEDGSQLFVKVYPVGKPDSPQIVEVKRIRIAESLKELRPRLVEEFRLVQLPAEQIELLADLVATWVTNRGLPTTLDLDPQATERDYAALISSVAIEHEFKPGDRLVPAGRRITAERLEVLRREHVALVASMTAGDMLAHTAASLGMYAAVFLFCGTYVLSHRRLIATELRRLITLLALAVATVGLGRLCTGSLWEAELVPILLFSMTVAIVYWRELALVLSAAMALVLCLAFGMGLAEFVLMVATSSAAVLLLNRVRSRTKMIYVGLVSGTVAILTTIGVGTLSGDPLGSWSSTDVLTLEQWKEGGSPFAVHLMAGAAWHGFCAVLAALIITALLPFIERLFDVQTDLSLLELGDAAHPLLQELARRAPGTYNHSINVASLAEAAAESIGANGLLVRVGSYFHDIGKVFKPGYFVENQGREGNRHESLLPAMSTLVIIAHVKDGADLARQNRLPKPIVDFIEQHHGTTLVEYFYQQAAKQSENDPDGEEVEEASYRYPGPKPQTCEAGVLMLADAVESASRTLVDPTPARIENLVEGIVMKRLLDGQFDECGITLLELSRIRDSLAKSLTAVYHSRVKYPDQQTA